MKIDSTPKQDGYFMPAEFGPHERCWMAWPRAEEVFSGRLDRAKVAYARVAQAISRFEPVTMLADDPDVTEAARMCGGAIEVVPMPLDDSWTRDTGPTFVKDGQGRVAGVDWKFNGWGGVWPDCEKDARLAGAVIDRLGLPKYEADFVLEGGAIHVDGQGTLMAVAPCVLDPKRNPGLSLAEMERLLTAYLGVRHFIWLEHGLENDETAGHIDNVACFARPGLVLLNTTPDPADGNYGPMRENLKKLKSSTDAVGRPIEVIEVEQPARREGKDGRMALSYINFYLPNNGLVAPAFDDPRDGRPAAPMDGSRRISG